MVKMFTRSDGWRELLIEIRQRLTEVRTLLKTSGPGSSERDAILGGAILDVEEVLSDYEAVQPKDITSEAVFPSNTSRRPMDVIGSEPG